jgi:hypothetical protein
LSPYTLRKKQPALIAGAFPLVLALLLGPTAAGQTPAVSSKDAFAALAEWADNPEQRLSPEQFATIHALIRPQPYESLWAQIPWMTSLWEARKRAAAEGKPLFVWVISDGHPCGLC